MVSPLANRIEIINELTILVLTYGHLLFTDYMPEPETRNVVGVFYIGVILLNVGIHLIVLIIDICFKGKFACRRCFYLCKFKCR